MPAGSVELLAVKGAVRAAGQGSRRYLQRSAVDKQRERLIGRIAVAVEHVDGKIECPARGRSAVKRSAGIQVQTGRQVRWIIYQPVEIVVATRSLKLSVVGIANLAVWQRRGGGDLNSIANLNREINRAVVIGDVDVLTVRALIG